MSLTTAEQTTSDEPLATRATLQTAVDSLITLEQRNLHVLALLAHRFGVGKTDLRALAFLGHNRDATPKQLAEHLQLSTSATTNLIDRMEAAGLVARVSNPSDRRSSVLELAIEGEDVARRVTEFYEDAFAKAVPAEQFDAVAAALQSIGDALIEAAEASPADAPQPPEEELELAS
jgi:DNA-binding MarR family transcriptional regulator